MTGLEYPKPTRARQRTFAPAAGSFSTVPDSVQTAERSGPLHCGQSDPKSCREQKKTRAARYFATVIVGGLNLRGGTSFVVPRFAIGGKENRSFEDSSADQTFFRVIQHRQDVLPRYARKPL